MISCKSWIRCSSGTRQLGVFLILPLVVAWGIWRDRNVFQLITKLSNRSWFDHKETGPEIIPFLIGMPVIAWIGLVGVLRLLCFIAS